MTEHGDQRQYPRLDVLFALRLDFELGAEGSKACVGTTLNVSRGGILATIEQRVPLQAQVAVEFVDCGDRVSPTSAIARVLRLEPRGDGFLVALVFGKPLDRLEVAKTSWKPPYRASRS